MVWWGQEDGTNSFFFLTREKITITVGVTDRWEALFKSLKCGSFFRLQLET